MTGKRDEATGLWNLPINPQEKPTTIATIDNLDLHIRPNQRVPHEAKNVHTLPYLQNRMKYMHLSFFCPPQSMLIAAIDNGQLKGCPFMTADNVRKYLPSSPVTSKGRMKRPRTGIRSTRPKKSTKEHARIIYMILTLKSSSKVVFQDTTESNSIPTHRSPQVQHEPLQQVPPIRTTNGPTTIPFEDESSNGQVNNIFCFTALADSRTGTFYTDATGALPAISLYGHQYYFIAYDYDTNYIFAIPIKNVTDEAIIEAFKEVFQGLKNKGHKPTFNFTDNQATNPIKAILKTEDCDWKFVEPTNHRVNAAEQAIQTFKTHLISGLCSTDVEWPFQLWNTMTEQSVITCNTLRTSRINPKKLAYHQLHGRTYDLNRFPLTPLGTRAVLYLDPENRSSWGARCIDAWYCGPSNDHYRCNKLYVPETRSYHISGLFDLFPQHCSLPDMSP